MMLMRQAPITADAGGLAHLDYGFLNTLMDLRGFGADLRIDVLQKAAAIEAVIREHQSDQIRREREQAQKPKGRVNRGR